VRESCKEHENFYLAETFSVFLCCLKIEGTLWFCFELILKFFALPLNFILFFFLILIHILILIPSSSFINNFHSYSHPLYNAAHCCHSISCLRVKKKKTIPFFSVVIFFRCWRCRIYGETRDELIGSKKIENETRMRNHQKLIIKLSSLVKARFMIVLKRAKESSFEFYKCDDEFIDIFSLFSLLSFL
jgi:hypothetical protein